MLVRPHRSLWSGGRKNRGGGVTSNEPVYTPGTDTLVWSDTFETYSVNQDVLNAYPAYANPQYLTFPSPDSGHASSKALRFTIPAQATYNDVSLVLEKNFGDIGGVPPGQVCVVEWWMKVPVNYPWRRIDPGGQDGAGTKTMIVASASNNRRMVMSIGVKPAGTFLASAQYSSLFPGAGNGIGYVLSHDGPTISGVGNAGSQWYIQNMNSDIRDLSTYLSDNQWHHIKTALTCSTSVTSTTGDGKVEMWIDGVQIMKYDGTDSSRPEYNQVLCGTTPTDNILAMQFPANVNGGPSTSQGDQWRDYDDIRVWVRATWPNEPAGYSLVQDQPWNIAPIFGVSSPTSDCGWNDDARNGSSRFQIISDATSPMPNQPNNNVIQGLFPSGSPGGSGPFYVWVNLSSLGTFSNLFIGFWLKHSANFDNTNGNSGTKLMWPAPDMVQGAQVYMGHDSSLARFSIFQQGPVDRAMLQNVGPAGFADIANYFGSWVRYEILLKHNTANGTADGEFHCWITNPSGVTSKTHQYTDVNWNMVGSPRRWYSLAWNPTYGGGPNPVPHDQYQYIDHIHISGSNS